MKYCTSVMNYMKQISSLCALTRKYHGRFSGNSLTDWV